MSLESTYFSKQTPESFFEQFRSDDNFGDRNFTFTSVKNYPFTDKTQKSAAREAIRKIIQTAILDNKHMITFRFSQDPTTPYKTILAEGFKIHNANPDSEEVLFAKCLQNHHIKDCTYPKYRTSYVDASMIVFNQTLNKVIVVSDFFQDLNQQIQDHIQYLSIIGFEERAKGIQFSRFHNDSKTTDIDLTPFEKRSSIPQEVLDFDPSIKNTLITTDPNTSKNNPEDLKKILDIRLHPPLRNLILENKLEVFLGTRSEMAAYYKSKLSEILYQFTIPSTATYYLVKDEKGKFTVVMAGLSSRENIIAQLLTLKLAGKTENIEIIGDPSHFRNVVHNDIKALLKEIPEIKNGINPLIVAGCDKDGSVCEIIKKQFPDSTGETKSFKGDIVSLFYIPLKNPTHGIHGFISLNLNYGEIMEDITSLLLENCNCKHVFTGGAGGFIPRDPTQEKPEIGSRIYITQSMNPQGELVTLEETVTEPGKLSAMHLQIPSIFLETYPWLENAKQIGESVDVETFYIIKAIQNYNNRNSSQKVKGDCGYFVSDHVGEQPLRHYRNVYQNYEKVLSDFIQRSLAKPMENKLPAYTVYNPKSQTASDIIIKDGSNDPKVPHAPKLDASFIDKIPYNDEQYRSTIVELNPKLDEQEIFTKKNWNVEYYNRLNYPVILGELQDKQAFSTKRNNIGLRFLDMPIFMPNQGWKIPPELEQFKEVIEKAIAFERNVNPDFESNHYVYITVDQGEVKPGANQRREGWHGDSYMKVDSRKKDVSISCDHVYVIADSCPTPFLPGPFSFEGVDPENIDDVLKHLATVAEGKIPDYYPSHTLLKLDPYCVHNVGFNNSTQTIFRTFVKISISRSRYCKLGNAHNYLLTYDWPMIPRHNVPYNKGALQQSSHRKDRDKFVEIYAGDIDFSKNTCKVNWAKTDVQSAFRKNEVFAQPAKEGEVLQSINDGFLITINVAEKGDYKITASHGDQYFLSPEKLNKFYSEDPDRHGIYLPKPVERRFVELTENVRFKASWGTMQYASKGDVLMCVDRKDIYAMPREFFYDEFNIKT